jgi:hypothetical protein
MSWGMVAVAGATVVGGVMSSNSASKAGKTASKADKAAMAFEQQKYDDWKATYGGVEDNLSKYYNSLTPDFYEAQGLEAFQKEQNIAMEKVKSSLAQRGIDDSGIAIATEAAMLGQEAEGRAHIRATAPSMAMEEQRGFLQVGLGQNPGSSLSQTLANRAQSANTTAQNANAAAGQAMGTAVTAVGTALGDYLNKPATPTPTPAAQVPA